MKYVFGPVPSRRLGNSLGVDLLTFKACTFDCVYCQLGRTTELTTQRRSFVPADEVIAEVRQALSSEGRGEPRVRPPSSGPSPVIRANTRFAPTSAARVDYVTLSGSGEPTLSLDLGRVIRAIKSFTKVPVAVLTNGSLLGRPEVRVDLAEADVVVPSLDAGTQETFERVNRAQGMDVRAVARGIRVFSLSYGGGVWLEVMVVAGLNDSPEEARAIVAALEGARIDKVQLNTVVRAPAEPWAQAVGGERLRELAAILEALAPVEIIGSYSRERHTSQRADVEEAILATLARRPCGAAELATSLGVEGGPLVERIEELVRAGRLERVRVAGAVQYRVPPPATGG
jgi:wyosine [tRNA(Phe)-imidazoG37] synthetase (radical SAM superfamily)